MQVESFCLQSRPLRARGGTIEAGMVELTDEAIDCQRLQ